MTARGTWVTLIAGTAFALLYSMMMSSADAITKVIASDYAAPQMFFLSGGIVAALCYLSAKGKGTRMRTAHPWAMAVRAVLTVAGSVGFFYALKLIPLAQVFIFVGLMPLMAGILSRPVLGERLRPVSWLALLLGFGGVLFLFPGGITDVQAGHVIAFAASLMGTGSLVAARYIGRHEDNALALVFFPNLALCVFMAFALPWVFKPVTPTALMLTVTYSIFLFGGRLLLVRALSVLPAYVATLLLHAQFVWGVMLGIVLFGEVPGLNTYAGAALVVGSGVLLMWVTASANVRRVASASGGRAVLVGVTQTPSPANLSRPAQLGQLRSRSLSRSRTRSRRWGYRSQTAPRSVLR